LSLIAIIVTILFGVLILLAKNISITLSPKIIKKVFIVGLGLILIVLGYFVIGYISHSRQLTEQQFPIADSNRTADSIKASMAADSSVRITP
jgi:hypothetical protein